MASKNLSFILCTYIPLKLVSFVVVCYSEHNSVEVILRWIYSKRVGIGLVKMFRQQGS